VLRNILSFILPPYRMAFTRPAWPSVYNHLPTIRRFYLFSLLESRFLPLVARLDPHAYFYFVSFYAKRAILFLFESRFDPLPPFCRLIFSLFVCTYCSPVQIPVDMLDSLGRQVGLLDIGNLGKPPFLLRRIVIVTKGRERASPLPVTVKRSTIQPG
jgi:hypothetical protein